LKYYTMSSEYINTHTHNKNNIINTKAIDSF
jgi:hypothetical protein